MRPQTQFQARTIHSFWELAQQSKPHLQLGINTQDIQYYRNSESAEVSEAEVAFKTNKPTNRSFSWKSYGICISEKKFLGVFSGVINGIFSLNIKL